MVLVLAALAGPVAAQAPRVTPAGDPSVRDDSLYALAVRPEDHADGDFVYLLDDGIVRLEADGRGARTFRQIVQVLNREAAEQWGEMSFSYEPERERLTLNWVRVLSLDGRVLASGPAHQQESRSNVAESAPVYTEHMIRRISIGGVAPGTIVDYSYTVEVLNPLVPGDYESSWGVTTGRLTRRSRFILDVPAGVTPNLKEVNWAWPRPVTTRAGRRVFTWAAVEVPRIEREPFAAVPNTLDVWLAYALPRTWEQVAAWYHTLAEGRYALTPVLEQELTRAVAGRRTLEDSLRAVHRWVAQDFRYVSLSLGLGGYQPRTPAQVLETRYGDCKDKATLFIAMARRLGVQAWPVLLSLNASADSALPSVRQFDHMIAAFQLPGRSDLMYADLTADVTPFGELPPGEQGGFAVVVRDGGRAERVVLPLAPPLANRSEVLVAGALSEAGLFSGRFERTGTGSRQYPLRASFLEPIPADQRERFLRTAAGAVYEGATGDSLETFAGRDLESRARVAFSLRGGRALTNSGGLALLRLPIDNMASGGIADDLEARGTRRFPIDVTAVVGPFEHQVELRVTLPKGWRARLPDNISAESDFGTYRAEYVQVGQEVRVTRFLAGRRGVEPASRVGDLIAWVRDMSRDDAQFLVLERPARQR